MAVKKKNFEKNISTPMALTKTTLKSARFWRGPKSDFLSPRLLGVLFVVFIIGFFAKVSDAASILDIEFMGGGCDMQQGECVNADWGLNGNTLTITKNFNKTEGEDDGEDGPGKPPDVGNPGESDDTHTGDDTLERLPPIHMFITLQNNEQANTYMFNEKISNNTGVTWDGFFFALAMFEVEPGVPNDRAKFNKPPDGPTSDSFAAYKIQQNSTRLTYSDGSVESGPVSFDFSITFGDALETKEDGTFSVMLQEFPLAGASEPGTDPVPDPTPEPATMVLFGTGLAGLAGAARRKRK